MVQLRQRSNGRTVARRVRDREVGGVGHETQSGTTPTSGDRTHRFPRVGDGSRLAAHRRQTSRRRTYVRSFSERSARPPQSGRATPGIGVDVVEPQPGRLLRLVDWYQRAFEGRPSPCRFTPSCSSYAREALELHGSRRGLWLTLRRLARCRPFGPSGFEPVPMPDTRRRPDVAHVDGQHHGPACSPAMFPREGSMT